MLHTWKIPGDLSWARREEVQVSQRLDGEGETPPWVQKWKPGQYKEKQHIGWTGWGGSAWTLSLNGLAFQRGLYADDGVRLVSPQ
jgi:hypothetical protein